MTAMRVLRKMPVSRGEAVRVGPCVAVALRVARGRVWLTETGLRQDAILGAGDVYRFCSPGAAVAEAVEPAVIELLAPLHHANLWLRCALLRAALAHRAAHWRARTQFGLGDVLAPRA